ncbi:hypothetical protein AGOR_G00176180 [Albula goreensis]|uniref:Uncharacterized protein n=1 Tax=Albula goreensis TaxID=1534307 RepID=A0A8T3CY16_9TELE|nr:hypothetical protein AGOR_G00176180 [Albula goreensis]
MEGGSVVVHAVLIILAVLSSVLSEAFAAAAAGHRGIFPGVFHTTTWNTSETFPIEASLDGWVDSTWIMLNVWSAGWLIYAFSTVLRRNVFGPVCCNPEIHPPSFYLIWIFINIARILWLCLWDRQYIFQALAMKILIPFCCFAMLFISYRNLHLHGTWLAMNSPSETWYIRFMTQNGLALYAAWTTIEALVNFGVVLKYCAGFQDPPVSTVVLTLLFVGLLLWFIFESFVFQKYILYTFSVYPVVILGLGAMFTKSYRFNNIPPNTIYCGFLMIVTTILNSIRLVAVCFYRETKKPLHLSKHSFPLTDSCETVCKVEGQDGISGKSGVVNIQFSEN